MQKLMEEKSQDAPNSNFPKPVWQYKVKPFMVMTGALNTKLVLKQNWCDKISAACAVKTQHLRISNSKVWHEND